MGTSVDEYFNIRPLVHDEWILLLDKFIFKSFTKMRKLKFYKYITNYL